METEYRFGTGEIEAVLATDAEARYRWRPSWNAGCRVLPAMSDWSVYCPGWMGAAQSYHP